MQLETAKWAVHCFHDAMSPTGLSSASLVVEIKTGKRNGSARREAGNAAAGKIAVAWPPQRHDSRFRSNVSAWLYR
jgi:hypothetical protein